MAVERDVTASSMASVENILVSFYDSDRQQASSSNSF